MANPVTHLEKTIAGEVSPVTHLEHVIAEYGGGGGGGGFTPTQEQLDAINSGATTAKIEQIETNKNNILSDYGGTIGKNILNTKIILGEVNDLTATLNDDKSITVNGTSRYDSGSVPFILGAFTPIVGKTYVCKGTGNANIRINIFGGASIVCSSSDDATFTAEAGKSYIASVWVAAKPESGTQFNNVTIYPMICEQTIYTADSSYQPYILSNAELTAKENQNENNISKITPITLSKRYAPQSADYEIISDLTISIPAGKKYLIHAMAMFNNVAPKGVIINKTNTIAANKNTVYAEITNDVNDFGGLTTSAIMSNTGSSAFDACIFVKFKSANASGSDVVVSYQDIT